jgi:superfamily I DNA/RNA helicase
MTMKLPLLTKLEDEQMAVYTQPADQSVVVIGPPGSGKTSLAIWRALFAARQGQEVVLITRGRMLTAMAQELGKEGAAQEGGSFTTSTMQSFVFSDCLKQIKRAPNRGNGDFELNWARISGWYEEMGIKPHIDHLIVDEGQNLPAGFLTWAVKYVAKTFSLFADEHQTTVEEGTTMSQVRALGIPTWCWLAYNHRNTEEIAKLSGWFHRNRRLPQAIAKRGSSGNVPRIERVAHWERLAEMVATRLSNAGGSIGVITYEQADVEAIYKAIRAAVPLGRRVDWFHSRRDRGEEYFSIRDDGVTVLSSESAIGLEFDTLYLQDLSRSLNHPGDEADRRLYMLTARARDVLVLVNGLGELKAAQSERLPPEPLLVR